MKFWSISTTVRNPERVRGFLKVLSHLEGQRWDGVTQRRFQIFLLLNRCYGYGEPQFENPLTDEQKSWLYSDNFSEERAELILESKKYKGGIEMRGRQSYNPIEKMGFANLDENNCVKITDFGRHFLREDYDLGEVFFRSFLKWQYPNPDVISDYPANAYNVKPFIVTLHLINKVNSLCEQQKMQVKGVSRVEFALFFTTLADYRSIEIVAQNLLEFRGKYEALQKQNQRDVFVQQYFEQHFSDFQYLQNAFDYADNIIRNFRLTRYLHLRGNNFYLDLESRRKIEIDALLTSDSGEALSFGDISQWQNYLGNINLPVLPWETLSKLHEIRKLLLKDIEALVTNAQNANIPFPVLPEISDGKDKNSIANDNKILREYRRKLFDINTHYETQQIVNIENCINQLEHIFDIKDNRPAEFERLVYVGLQALNDAIEIRPNYPVTDDNLPTFTAPANQPDIECYYQTFDAICEVTLLKNRSQWINEGQPVMRHLRNFEKKRDGRIAYCLFIAPRLHVDTVNTFWNSVRYEYEGETQRIIPITTSQFCSILRLVIELKRSQKPFTHQMLENLFSSVVDVISQNISNSQAWISNIPHIIDGWRNKLAN